MSQAQLHSAPVTAHGQVTGGERRTLAVIAGTYPLPSETFVYREVAALRDRGWTVPTVSLHPAPAEPADVTGRREPSPLLVYGNEARRTLAAAAREALGHPLHTLRTLATATRDAIGPGERMPWHERSKLPAQAVFAIGLAHRLRSLGVGHVHCHFAHAPASVGMYAAAQLRVPWSFTGHANDIFQRRALLRRKLERAAFVSCISQWHRAFYQTICARDATAYPVIRCGVAVEQWRPTDRVRGDGEPMHVVTVGRLVEKKGIDALLRAVGSLASEQPGRWRLTVAGDGPMRGELEALARELGCEAAVTWRGAVANPEVRELLAEADVFALPCRTDRHQDRDGIPVVLMEAMACGVPVVAGDLEAIGELIAHERTGLLVPGGDDRALAAALTRLEASSRMRRELGLAGRERVCEEFSQAVNVDRLAGAIRAVTTRAGKPQVD